MPIVSVIMPIFNKGLNLEQSIRSVLGQKTNNIELILIDDGSTDNSPEIALKYQKKDSRVKYYYQENHGVSLARNKGILLAKGDYISFLDADDKWDEHFLSEMLKSIEDKNVCYCGHFYNIAGKLTKSRMDFVSGDVLLNYIKNVTTPNTNSWLIKRDYILEYNIRFPEGISWGEDMTFFIKVLIHDTQVKSTANFLTYYNISDTNSLSENSIDKIAKDLFWMESVVDYLKVNIDEQKRLSKLINCFQAYRMPAAIIYRLYKNLNQYDHSILIDALKKYDEYIKKVRITNGVRSVKLVLFYALLMFKLRK